MSNTRDTPWIHPLSWLLSNNRLAKVPFVSVLHTSSNRLLLSNQDKGCTPSVAHSLPLPLGPALLNLSYFFMHMYLQTISTTQDARCLLFHRLCSTYVFRNGKKCFIPAFP